MRRNLFYALLALSLATANASAGNVAVVPQFEKTSLLVENKGKAVPDVVKAFLATPMGRHFTAEQVMAAYNNVNCIMKAESGNAASETKIDEDFSKLTAGSEDAPDATNIADLFDNYTTLPGWGAFLTYQAGGKAYLGYDEVGEDGPGYLMTPAMDLSDGDGVFKVTFRVKNVNPNVNDQGLQYFIMNDDPDASKKSMISAASLPMTTDWTDLVLYVDGGVKSTSVMFLGWQGKVLVDNVKLEKLTYPLTEPKNVKLTTTSGSELTATWDAVDGATGYYVELLDDNFEGKKSTYDEQVVATTTVSEPTAKLSFQIIPSHKYIVRVTATNGDDKSFPARGYTTPSVSKVDAPVALAATDVTTSGFTANWESSLYAANYKASFVRTHTATEDGETLTYINEDFSQIPYSMNDPKGTVQTADFVTPVSLDNLFNTPGWSTLLGVGYTGMFGITNMYESYGLPGALFGPVADFTIGEGKAKISGTAMTSVDDAQVKVGFGKLGAGNSITFNEGAKVFEVSKSGSPFDVEISGGSKDSRLIFQIIDAAEGGDIVIFTNMKATADLKKDDTYTLPYCTVTLPYDATSYKMEVPFTGNDKFEYTVTGTFGDKASEESNTITVYSPEATAISSVKGETDATATYTTLDGMRVDYPVKAGVYIVKKNGKTFKVMK